MAFQEACFVAKLARNARQARRLAFRVLVESLLAVLAGIHSSIRLKLASSAQDTHLCFVFGVNELSLPCGTISTLGRTLRRASPLLALHTRFHRRGGSVVVSLTVRARNSTHTRHDFSGHTRQAHRMACRVLIKPLLTFRAASRSGAWAHFSPRAIMTSGHACDIAKPAG